MRAMVFDTETTGLPLHPAAKLALQPKPIEFGAVILEDGKVVDERVILINPKQTLEPIITKITGLTDEDLAGAAEFPGVEQELRELTASCDTVVAHNLPFDTSIIDLAVLRHDLKPWPWPRLKICTVQEHAEEWGKRPRLLDLYEHYMGKPLKQTHRALDDVYALVDVCLASGVLDDSPA